MLIDQFKIGADGRATVYKDPDALLDYTFDWSDYLAALGGDRLVDAAFTSSAGELTATELHEGMAVAWLAGGTTGSTIALNCRITTAGGRVDACTAFIKIRER
jgi:hypothetical protein